MKRDVFIKLLKFHFSWPIDDDKWFYCGPSWIMSFQYRGTPSSVRYELYGWRISIGPCHLILGFLPPEWVHSPREGGGG